METQLDYFRTLGKEIDMRTGNVLLLLLLVLIGFGALLYHSIDLSRELALARNELAQTQAAMQTLEAQVQALTSENEQLVAHVAVLSGANASLLAQVTTLENERLALEEKINALQTRLAVMDKAHPILAWLTSSSSAYRLAAMFILPVVPITFGVVYVANHKRHGGPASSGTIHTELTAEEFQLIVQRRKLLALRRRINETVSRIDSTKG